MKGASQNAPFLIGYNTLIYVNWEGGGLMFFKSVIPNIVRFISTH